MPFALGQVCCTPGANDAMEQRGINPVTLLRRHVSGDWGSVCASDKRLNDEAIKGPADEQTRVLSAYQLDESDPTGDMLWIITEWDRSVTTFLLPNEY